MLSKRIKNQKGLTIIELLLYMGIFSLLIGVLMQVFTTILDTQLESEATSSTDENGRYILSRFEYDISRANSVTTPSSLGASGNTLSVVIGGITYTYTLNGNNLQLVNNNGTDVLNGYDATISGLSFQRIGNSGGKDTVKVTYTVTSVTKEARKGAEVKTYTTTIGMR